MIWNLNTVTGKLFKFLIGRFQQKDGEMKYYTNIHSNSSLAGFSKFVEVFNVKCLDDSNSSLAGFSGMENRIRDPGSCIQIPHWPVSAQSWIYSLAYLEKFKFLIGRFQPRANPMIPIANPIQIPHWPVSAEQISEFQQHLDKFKFLIGRFQPKLPFRILPRVSNSNSSLAGFSRGSHDSQLC